MDNYISIIFKFQLAIGTSISEIPNIGSGNYFSYGIDSSFYPYPKPNKDELGSLSKNEKFALEMGEELSGERRKQIESISKKHNSELTKWEMDCIQNPKFRIELKGTAYNRVQKVYDEIIKSKTEVRPGVDHDYLYNYSTYTKSAIDCWLKIWSEMDLKKESLENLITFSNLRWNCLDEKLVSMNERKISEERRKTYEYFKAEERHYTRNSYEEGGGGDEWSDSSSYW